MQLLISNEDKGKVLDCKRNGQQVVFESLSECKEFCSAVVNVKSSCCLLLDARPTSPVTLLDNTGHPAPDHQTQVTTTYYTTATTTNTLKRLIF